MKKATIKEQAEKLIHECGDAAYQKAQEAARDARRHRNSKLERYWAEVAREIARYQRPSLLGAMRRSLVSRLAASERNCIVDRGDEPQLVKQNSVAFVMRCRCVRTVIQHLSDRRVEMRRAGFFGHHPPRDKEHQLASPKCRRERARRLSHDHFADRCSMTRAAS